eukprot:gene5123-6378_t
MFFKNKSNSHANINQVVNKQHQQQQQNNLNKSMGTLVGSSININNNNNTNGLSNSTSQLYSVKLTTPTGLKKSPLSTPTYSSNSQNSCSNTSSDDSSSLSSSEDINNSPISNSPLSENEELCSSRGIPKKPSCTPPPPSINLNNSGGGGGSNSSHPNVDTSSLRNSIKISNSSTETSYVKNRIKYLNEAINSSLTTSVSLNSVPSIRHNQNRKSCSTSTSTTDGNNQQQQQQQKSSGHQHHHHSHHHHNHHQKPIIITSKPVSESNWEPNPESFKMEETKSTAIKEIEFILSQLSSSQKILNERNDFIFDSNHSGDLIVHENKYKEKKNKVSHDINVILEILKQFNFGFDTIDIDTVDQFDTLGGDEMERKIFLLAKKILYLKMEISKSSSLKRVFILFTIINFISKYLKSRIIPNEVPSVPIEMTITMGIGSSILSHISTTIYKKGYLIKKKNRPLGAKFSTKWIVLTHCELLIYSSEKEDTLILKKNLNEMNQISITPKDGYPFTFSIHFIESDHSNNNNNNNNGINNNSNNSLSMSSSNEDWNLKSPITTSNNGNGKKSKTLVFSCENQEELGNWVLSFDGILNSNFKSCMDLSQKEPLLSYFKSNFKGGMFRFGDEEWHYCDGKLQNQSWGELLEYNWDGCTLEPSPNSKILMGKGRWNGVWLTWYGEGKTKDPYLKYLYQPIQRQYIVDSYPIRNQYTWTWSRHFLVSSYSGGGEWICEGEIPPVLVMLVQMMKYYKVGR